MTEVREFVSAVRRDEPIPFKLDGVEYGFRPPKEAIYVLENPYEWLDQGLAAYDRDGALAAITTEDPEARAAQEAEIREASWRGTTAAEFERRLRDPQDPFDIANLDEIIKYLREQVAGRPTT
jgi:hypothetical protein